MLDYLCGSLLYTPFRQVLMVLVAGAACGVMGWRRVSSQVRAAWGRDVVHPEIVGPGAYRAALWKTQLLRMPLPVSAFGFTSYALWVGRAGAIVVSVDAVLKANALLAMAKNQTSNADLAAQGGRRARRPRVAPGSIGPPEAPRGTCGGRAGYATRPSASTERRSRRKHGRAP
jgi:hypothetical protein